MGSLTVLLVSGFQFSQMDFISNRIWMRWEKNWIPGFVKLVYVGRVPCFVHVYDDILLESSILHFQGHHLIIDWMKVRRYGYYWAEGHRGTEGDSWEGLPHNSNPGQIVHFQHCWHLKKSNSWVEFKAGPEADPHPEDESSLFRAVQLSFKHHKALLL